MTLTKKNMLSLITSGLSPATRMLLSNKKNSKRLPNFLEIASKLKNNSLTKKYKKPKKSKRIRGGSRSLSKDERIENKRARSRARSRARIRAQSLARIKARIKARSRVKSRK